MKAFLGAVIVALAATLQTSCADALSWIGLAADLPLVVVLSFAALSGEGAALAVAACAGLCKDAFSAGHFGDSAAVFVPLAFGVIRLRGALWLAHWTAQSAIALVGTCAAGALYALAAAARGEHAYADPSPVLVSAGVNACLAPACFRVWRAVLR